jgi:hypothetical protein
MKAENANLLKIEELERRVAELERNGLMAFLEIRKAIGDPEGRLSQPEVVKKVQDLVEALSDLLTLSENADETGYVDGEGWLPIERIQQRAHDLLKPASSPLADALSIVGSCTCLTKSPKVEHHKEDCRYRKLMANLSRKETP